MRHKKSFFTKNNILNKIGVSNDTGFLNQDPILVKGALAEYEGIDPSLVQKLFEMAQKEQEHAHNMENINSRIKNSAIRMGRFSSIFIVIAICYFTYHLMISDHIFSGLIFAVISFAFMLLMGCKHKCSIKNDSLDKTTMNLDSRNPNDKEKRYNNGHRSNHNRYHKRKY